MVIKNLEFIKVSTSTIQGGGLKNDYRCFPKAWAFGRIYGMAAGVHAELMSCVKTTAIVDRKKITATIKYKLLAHVKS